MRWPMEEKIASSEVTLNKVALNEVATFKVALNEVAELPQTRPPQTRLP